MPAILDKLALAAEMAESEMLYGGFFAPMQGLREDLPSVSVADSFTQDNENVLVQDGLIERAKMRLPEPTEQAFSTGTITATNGSKTITASGGGGTFSTSATHKPYWTGRTITITDDGADTDYTIDSVSDAGDTLELTENYDGTGGAGLAYSIGTPGTHVCTPDSNPILRYDKLLRSSGGSETEYLFGFTKAHAYLWSPSWSAWMLKFTCGSDCEQWSSDHFNNQIIATNNVDKVQVWGTTTTAAFANLTGDANGIDVGGGTYLTAAKAVRVFENFVFLMYVTIAGTAYPYTGYWCTGGNETDWDQTGSGNCGDFTIQGSGVLLGAETWRHYMVVAFAERMFYFWAVTTEDVFNWDVLTEYGCLAPHSMITDQEGRFYFLADDYTIRRMPGQEIISTTFGKTLQEINTSLQGLIEATYVSRYRLLLWSIPYGSEATGNNKVVWYEPASGKSGKLDIAAPCFGEYTRQAAYTIDTIPFDTIDEIGWSSIDAVENTAGFPLELCSDYSGYTYTMFGAVTDNGEAYTGYAVIGTDLLERVIARRYGVGLHEYKRVETLEIVCHSENTGTLNVSVKRDTEAAWEDLGNVSLVDESAEIITLDLPCDVRLRHGLFKLSGTSPFRLVGLIIGFLRDGVS